MKLIFIIAFGLYQGLALATETEFFFDGKTSSNDICKVNLSNIRFTHRDDLSAHSNSSLTQGFYSAQMNVAASQSQYTIELMSAFSEPNNAYRRDIATGILRQKTMFGEEEIQVVLHWNPTLNDISAAHFKIRQVNFGIETDPISITCNRFTRL